MASRFILVLFSTLGLGSIFLPWLYFPIAQEYFYGYRADGAVTGFLFLVILVMALTSIKKSQINNILLVIIGLLGLLLAYITYSKITKMEISLENFTHENILVLQAFSGTQLGIGVYLSGIAGLGVFIMAIYTFISQRYFYSNGFASSNLKKYSKPAIFFLVTAIAFGFAFYMYKNRPLSESIIKSNITSNFDAMGQALLQGRYEEFVEFNHPVMVNSTGGKIKMQQALKESFTALNNNGITVKNIAIKSVDVIKQEGKKVQAIFSQETLLYSMGQEESEIQQMLAVSSDNGKTFKFINITGKTKEDITKYFPGVLKDFKF